MDKIRELKKCVKYMVPDAEKFFTKNNQTAGVRLRKQLQVCKRISQNIRNLVQFFKFKVIQKKAKIKAARAAYFGQNILGSQKFQLECLRGTDLKDLKGQTFDNFIFEKKNNDLEFERKIAQNYDFDNLFNLKTHTPIPSYSIFNYNP